LADALFLPAFLALLLAAYWLLVVRTGSHAYLDYVDGYYLYVAHRMAQGATLYSGVMGVQPPGIYVVGAALFRLHDQLATVRVFSAMLHCATILVVAATAFRVSGRRGPSLLAAALYTLAPYGLIWSRTFDPNPLVTLGSLCSLYALLGDSRRSTFAAGVLGALALLTKVWYLPVAVATLIWMVRRRERLAPFLAGLVVPLVLAGVLGSLGAGRDFWQGMLVQDASPISGSWFESSVYHVLADDWPLLVLGLLGTRSLWRSGADRDRLLALWGVWSCVVLVATVKEGTAWPVFQFAEPFLAVNAALWLARAAGARAPAPHRPWVFWDLGSWIGLALVAFVSLPSIHAASTWPNGGEDRLTAVIRTTAAPGAQVLAPPFYLYLAGRRGVDRYADINLWGLQARKGDPRAVAALASLVRSLDDRSIPIVFEDIRVRALQAVTGALEAHYRRLSLHDTLPGDRSVIAWVPR
jgi:4-amino-4-deoxy-L-arabinose transferase-like glycosyltransferase